MIEVFLTKTDIFPIRVYTSLPGFLYFNGCKEVWLKGQNGLSRPRIHILVIKKEVKKIVIRALVLCHLNANGDILMPLYLLSRQG
jgi:hypothetical protein